jgi:riboflavin synthase
MFSGIVEAVGDVVAVDTTAAGRRIRFRGPEVVGDLPVGGSVAVDGACLTAVEVHPDGFTVDVIGTTLSRTIAGTYGKGARVNLERALRIGDRLDGHLVQGHVDGVGHVRAVRTEGESAILEVAAPGALLRYIVEKGSITVDGVSLTVAARLPDSFTVALIPHTMEVTTLGPQALERPVNLEVDVVAKYVESLAAPYAPEGTGG